jgi:GWxTD domain-containing protein
MKLLVKYFLFLFLAVSVYAQVENSVKPGPGQPRANFFLDALSFKSDTPGETRLDIFVQVPYTEIQFIKSGDKFTAGYTVSISVYDEEKEKIIVEKIWSEKIDSRDFDQTILKNNYNLSMRSFSLVPGKYFIRTSVEDKESRKTFAQENIYTIRDFSKKPALSDILLISKLTTPADSASAGSNVKTNKILPNISKNVSMKRDGLPFFFEIYSDIPQDLKLNYQLVDTKDKIITSIDTVQHVDTGRTQVFYSFNNNVELGLGMFQLKVNIGERDNYVSTSSKGFLSRWIGVPTAIKDLDKAIEQLVYIASGGEIDEIEEAETQAEKIKRYMDFWKKKDPTPGSEQNEIFDEYYRRVAYANEAFSHYVEGWRTDRGMVFIILGAPNNVERHPFEFDSKPYEIWQYYELNKEFVFLDETGFGDYRLITPLYGDYYRFR